MKSIKNFLLTGSLCITFGLFFPFCEQEDNEIVINDPYAVEQADILAVFYDSMFEVDSMFRLFNETFELPVWMQPVIREAANNPMEKFCVGSVYLGNFLIEFVTYKIHVPGSPNYQIASNVHFVGFTNYMKDNVPSLDSIGIVHQQPFSFVYADGNGNADTLFRNTFFYRGSNMAMCLCQYYPECYTYPTFVLEGNPAIADHEEFHHYLKNQLYRRNGGPLGVENVDKIVIGTADYQKHFELFNTLFQPVKDHPAGLWRIKEGPAVELVAESGISGMKFNSMMLNVRNLENAKSFLDENEMEYLQIGNNIKLTGISKNLGFEFYLTN